MFDFNIHSVYIISNYTSVDLWSLIDQIINILNLILNFITHKGNKFIGTLKTIPLSVQIHEVTQRVNL